MVTILPPLVFLLAAWPSPALRQGPDARFRSSDCRVTFLHPADWEAARDTTDRESRCRFSVRPRDWQRRLIANDSLDVHTILIEIVPRGVWAQIAESPFRRQGHGWVVLGRHDLEAPADTVSGAGWSGVGWQRWAAIERETDPTRVFVTSRRRSLGTRSAALCSLAVPRPRTRSTVSWQPSAFGDEAIGSWSKGSRRIRRPGSTYLLNLGNDQRLRNDAAH